MEWGRASGQWQDGDQAASARLRNFFAADEERVQSRVVLKGEGKV